MLLGAADLTIDHVTAAGNDLKIMQAKLAAAGIHREEDDQQGERFDRLLSQQKGTVAPQPTDSLAFIEPGRDLDAQEESKAMLQRRVPELPPKSEDAKDYGFCQRGQRTLSIYDPRSDDTVHTRILSHIGGGTWEEKYLDVLRLVKGTMMSA
jgi:hypothetical protein